jgi:hypothetical protein
VQADTFNFMTMLGIEPLRSGRSDCFLASSIVRGGYEVGHGPGTGLRNGLRGFFGCFAEHGAAVVYVNQQEARGIPRFSLENEPAAALAALDLRPPAQRFRQATAALVEFSNPFGRNLCPIVLLSATSAAACQPSQ